MQKVLVLGGKGMLGHILVKTLLRFDDVNVKYTETGNKDNSFFFILLDRLSTM